MRIEAYNQIQQLYKAQKITKSTAAKSTGKRDSLELSSRGRDYQIAKQAVAGAPDVRMDLVEDMKTRVKNGTYNVSGESFADKLIAKFNENI